jgi:hypothetical protein
VKSCGWKCEGGAAGEVTGEVSNSLRTVLGRYAP